MRHTDLELYRWRWHHDVYIHTMSPSLYLSWNNYWKEHGAFISVLPRQCGKTQMLLTLMSYFTDSGEDYIIVYPVMPMRSMLINREVSPSKLYHAASAISNGTISGLAHKSTNLLVDEFGLLDKAKHIPHILDFPWNTVTMISLL